VVGGEDGPVRTGLAFRNVDASPGDPVETWPFEAVVAAVERGFLPDWRRLARAIAADPWGPVAGAVDDAVRLSHPYGTTELFHAVIARAHHNAVEVERREVAAEIGQLVARLGLSRQAFATRIGTSASRLSTYLSGKVMPSAALMVRMCRVASDFVNVDARTPD
jgi:Helix-turn-helix domain